MIPRLLLAKSAAIATAAIVHIAVLHLWHQPVPAMTQAGAGAAIAALGTSFANMVAGSQHPFAPRSLQRPVAPMDVVAPAPIDQARTQEIAVTEQDPVTVLAERPDPGGAIAPGSRLHPKLTLRQTQKQLTRTIRSHPAKTSVEAVDRSQTTSVGRTSLRPRLRPETAQRTSEGTRPVNRPDQTQPPPPVGQGTQTATRGDVTSKTAPQDQNQGRQTTTATTPGNAAASTYPGVVMRYIARQRRPDMNVRGTAVVSFTIASDGALASARLARSSGSAALDTAALRIVQRAAPFPPPPQGARRSHSIGIKGQG